MIDVSVPGYLVFFCLVIVASTAGVMASRCVPWTNAARSARLSFWSGFALGPLLAGLASVLALGVLPGAAHTTHMAFVMLVLGAVAVLAFVASRGSETVPPSNARPTKTEIALLAMVAVWCGTLLFNVISLPLTQNDALEYATVGRLLFEKSSLSYYPAIDPEVSRSGFYGPWTHPPLYVALVYLSQIIQGHADSPGLMRLIAPWVALAGTGVVYGVGRMVGRVTGAVAALVFLSTPLIFLSADAALIDPLPVLGFSLVMAALVGTGPTAVRRGVAVGGALALALWTHSQAFLFPFLTLAALCLWHGLAGWRRVLAEGSVLLITALVLAAWPYVRNISIFGSPVSDNPQVFAAPNLHWEDYFLLARGLDGLVPQIQYGIFKGWFALEAFSWSFWLMTVGLLVFAVQLGVRRIIKAAVVPETVLNAGQRVLWICSGLIVAYVAGVALSLPLGNELIRNERYLLIMMPAVAVSAGFGLAIAMQWASSMLASPACPLWMRVGIGASSAVLATAVILQVLVVGWYFNWVSRWDGSDGPLISMQRPPDGQSRLPWMLSQLPNTHVMMYMARSLPDEALVFTMQPADMYYSGRRMISYLDPRSLTVYEQPTADAMADRLSDLGVSHILIPTYYLPPIPDSALQQVTASPALTTLEYSAGGTQIYALAPEIQVETVVQEIGPDVRPWSRFEQLIIGGRKSLFAIPLSVETMTENALSERGGLFGLFHRDISTVLSLGIGLDRCGERCSKDLGSLPKVEGDRQYRLSLDLVGRGFVKIRILQYDEEGIVKTAPPDIWYTNLGDLALVPERGSQTFVRRFETLPGARRLGVRVEHLGHSSVMIEQATLERLGPGATSAARAKSQF